MNRLAHWCRHNNFLITATILYEFMIFFPRAGFYCVEEGGHIGFTWDRFIGKEKDGYERVWGKRMNPKRILEALKSTFPVPMTGWGEKPCNIDNSYCLYRNHIPKQMTHGLILIGSYLAMAPGFDTFQLPKLFIIWLGADLCLTKGMKNRKLRIPFLLLIISALVSAYFSGNALQSVIGYQRSSGMGIIGLVAAYLCYEVGERKHLNKILWGAGICAGIGVLQTLYTHGRAGSTIGCPPFLGCMLALAVPLALDYPWVLGLIISGILASGSRAGMIGAAMALAWQLFSIRGRIYTLLVMAFGAIIASPRVMGDNMRLQTWEVAIRIFLKHPMSGVGLDNFTDAFMKYRGSDWLAGPQTVQDNAHNLVFHVASTQGILGLASWVYMSILLDITPSLIAVLAYSMFEPVPFMAWCLIAYQWGANEDI